MTAQKSLFRCEKIGKLSNYFSIFFLPLPPVCVSVCVLPPIFLCIFVCFTTELHPQHFSSVFEEYSHSDQWIVVYYRIFQKKGRSSFIGCWNPFFRWEEVPIVNKEFLFSFLENAILITLKSKYQAFYYFIWNLFRQEYGSSSLFYIFLKTDTLRIHTFLSII